MKPMNLIILFAIFMVVILFISTNKNKRSRYSNNRYIEPKILGNNVGINIVSSYEYYKCPLMNKSEYSLFCRLNSHLEKNHDKQGFRLFTQVAMGEFIRSKDNNAFRLINNKRVDFLIIDRKGEATVVIEYQSAGHYQSNAVERDAIKKEACRKAGIEYIEFKENYDYLDFEIVSKILNLVQSKTSKE